MNTEKKPFVPKTPMDFQKLKLDRLMANPDKPVMIPETPKEKKGFSVPEFVRNVMGSSAGAGSGEFHVYRHLRRKEYTRQKVIDEKAEKERLDEDFHRKLDENKRKMEERTEKRRAKRLKRKEKMKQKRKQKGSMNDAKNRNEQSENSSEESEDKVSDNLDSENKGPGHESNENSHDGCSSENVNYNSNECSTSKE